MFILAASASSSFSGSAHGLAERVGIYTSATGNAYRGCRPTMAFDQLFEHVVACA